MPVGPCWPTSRDRTYLTLVAAHSLSGQLCCKVLPYMELKTASQCPAELLSLPRTALQIPEKSPVPRPALSTSECPAPLHSSGLGTSYPLSVGSFLEHVLPVTLFPIQEIQLS